MNMNITLTIDNGQPKPSVTVNNVQTKPSVTVNNNQSKSSVKDEKGEDCIDLSSDSEDDDEGSFKRVNKKKQRLHLRTRRVTKLESLMLQMLM